MLTRQLRELRTKLADPIDKVEESLSKYGEVAAAIADCDEKHPVRSAAAMILPDRSSMVTDQKANQADTKAVSLGAGYEIPTQDQDRCPSNARTIAQARGRGNREFFS